MLCQQGRAPSRLAASGKCLTWLSPEPSSSSSSSSSVAPAVMATLYNRPASRIAAPHTKVNRLRPMYQSDALARAAAAILFLTLALHINRDNDTFMLVRAEATAKIDAGQPANSNADKQSHPSLMVDTKSWTRNLEFNERYNWLDYKKPCTLIEQIVVSEQELIVSMGDSADGLGNALESSIKDLILAQSGILLLEADTVGARTADTMFVLHLNESGDCFDSSSVSMDGQVAFSDKTQVFSFEPHSDDMSWFNPANWRSELYDIDEFNHLVPESNQIPCSEDAVVFGHDQADFWPFSEPDDPSKLTTFKVNFRPSEQFKEPNPVNMAGLRVSKLVIGDKSYTQSEFDRLNDLYGDTLFAFSDKKSVFNWTMMNGGDDFTGAYGPARQSILTIDESSIQVGVDDSSHELCLEEAGCQCGNEHPDMMKIICSFNYPLDESNLPCHDPIQAPGYCNKICATSISISMDPTKFSERFLLSVLTELRDGEPALGNSDYSSSSSLSPGYFSRHVFAGARRIDYNKYDITLHLMVSDDDTYGDILGRDVEFAQLIRQRLEKAATKSFYGIKAITTKSSVRWRQNNHRKIFLISLSILLSFASFLFVRYDEFPSVQPVLSALNMIHNQFKQGRFSRTSSDLNEQRPPELSYIEEPSILEEGGTISGLPVVVDLVDDDDRHANDLALVELDAHSIADSTYNLIDPER